MADPVAQCPVRQHFAHQAAGAAYVQTLHRAMPDLLHIQQSGEAKQSESKPEHVGVYPACRTERRSDSYPQDAKRYHIARHPKIHEDLEGRIRANAAHPFIQAGLVAEQRNVRGVVHQNGKEQQQKKK